MGGIGGTIDRTPELAELGFHLRDGRSHPVLGVSEITNLDLQRLNLLPHDGNPRQRINGFLEVLAKTLVVVTKLLKRRSEPAPGDSTGQERRKSRQEKPTEGEQDRGEGKHYLAPYRFSMARPLAASRSMASRVFGTGSPQAFADRARRVGDPSGFTAGPLGLENMRVGRRGVALRYVVVRGTAAIEVVDDDHSDEGLVAGEEVPELGRRDGARHPGRVVVDVRSGLHGSLRRVTLSNVSESPLPPVAMPWISASVMVAHPTLPTVAAVADV